ncbi:MAG TPA: acyltransferase [Candidatus Aquilonibacter sp.]|nr:acyltransferase [Candidatus Aquilonibacter sp.]
MNRPRAGYLSTLDGWRAIAILGVLLYHDRVRSLGLFTTALPHRFGGLGVDLFFGISGLLITTRLLEEEKLFGAFSIKGFYIRRVFRIQPAALFFLGMIVLMHLLFHLPLVYKGVAEALCVVRNLAEWNYTDPGMRVTEHFWSLSVEEQFYLVLPALLLLLHSRRRRLIVLTGAALAFFLLAARAPKLHYYIDTRGHHTELNLHGLLFGSALAVLVSLPKTREKVRTVLRPWWILGACVVVAALRAHWHHYDMVWLSAAFPFIVLSTVLHPEEVAGRILEWAPLRFVGRISYSIYLWQQVFFVVGRLTVGTRWAWFESAAVLYPLIFGCALFSFYVIEKPMIRFGHRVAPPPTPGRADLHETPEVRTGPALA